MGCRARPNAGDRAANDSGGRLGASRAVIDSLNRASTVDARTLTRQSVRHANYTTAPSEDAEVLLTSGHCDTPARGA